MQANYIFNFVNDPEFFVRKPMEGRIIMDDEAFTHFVISCIRENATHNNDSYSLFACDLPDEDKRIFLSHIVSAEDYEYFAETPTRLQEAFKEYNKEMQHYININIDDVYHSDMWEMSGRLAPNAEYYYGDRR